MSVVVLAVIAGVWLQNRKEETKLSDLAMTNIEALAADEIKSNCKPNELVGYFLSGYTRKRTVYGKRCDKFGYHCPCGCSGWTSSPDCSCPEINTIIESGVECAPNTNDNSCCNKNDEEVYFNY